MLYKTHLKQDGTSGYARPHVKACAENDDLLHALALRPIPYRPQGKVCDGHDGR